jgi:assimilatory nitrate reductase catalytic subunit
MQMNGMKSSGMVCTCIGVSDSQINARLRQCPEGTTANDKFQDLQNHLQCGTSCGSCVPQIKRMISAQQ